MMKFKFGQNQIQPENNLAKSVSPVTYYFLFISRHDLCSRYSNDVYYTSKFPRGYVDIYPAPLIEPTLNQRGAQEP